jgi:hypothetical protein
VEDVESECRNAGLGFAPPDANAERRVCFDNSPRLARSSSVCYQNTAFISLTPAIATNITILCSQKQKQHPPLTRSRRPVATNTAPPFSPACRTIMVPSLPSKHAPRSQSPPLISVKSFVPTVRLTVRHRVDHRVEDDVVDRTHPPGGRAGCAPGSRGKARAGMRRF